MVHPLIARFQAAAEQLDIQGDHATLDDAITRLAAWMNLATDHLTENDKVVLVEIGALMYRDGLQRRINGAR